jgi:hypothetical protein
MKTRNAITHANWTKTAALESSVTRKFLPFSRYSALATLFSLGASLPSQGRARDCNFLRFYSELTRSGRGRSNESGGSLRLEYGRAEISEAWLQFLQNRRWHLLRGCDGYG